MRIQIRHEIRSRIRLHLPMKRLTFREADILDHYLQGFPEIREVIVYERTADVAILAAIIIGDYKTASGVMFLLKIGDTLEIQLGNRRIVAEVLKISEYANRETASELFRLISEEKIAQSFPEEQKFEE